MALTITLAHMLQCVMQPAQTRQPKEYTMLNNYQLQLAREWIKECLPSFIDLEEDDVDQLTDQQIVNGIKRHYAGGLAEFISNCS